MVAAIYLRPRSHRPVRQRLYPTDPVVGVDATRIAVGASVLRIRRCQFLVNVPNQIIVWTVVFGGVSRTASSGLNRGGANSWCVWTCLDFVMLVAIGRARCEMRPFAEVDR